MAALIMFSVWTLVVPACLLWLIKRLWHWHIIGSSDTNSPLPLPGGEFGWPIIGETVHLLFQGPSFYEKNFAKFGRVFKTHLFTKPTVRVYGADNIAKILQGENDIVASRWPASTRQLFGDHTLAMSQGVDHAIMRKRVFTAFSHSALTGYVSMVQKPVRDAIENWCDSESVLAAPVLNHLNFRVAADVLIGGFHYTDEEVSDLCQKIQDIINGLMSVPFDLPFLGFRKALRARDYIKRKLEDNVRRKTRLRSEEDTQDAMRILIDLANANDEESLQRLTEAICYQVIEFLLSGMSSLSSCAMTMLYHMAKNPEVLTKVREELGARGLMTDTTSPLTLDVINQCQYVKRVVKESLRMSPPVGAAFRTALKTFELDGKQIPKGWCVFWSIRETVHLSDTFTDTRTFDPDRFSPDRQEDRQGGRFSMPVFGQGSRSCIGQNYSMLVLRILLIEVARMCDYELCNPDNIEFAWIPAPKPKCGMKTRFRRLQTVTDQNENECCPGKQRLPESDSQSRPVKEDGVTERSTTCHAA